MKGRVGRGAPHLAEECDTAGLMDKIRGEFIDIVESTDDTRDTIVWRFPRHENEIKMNAKLVAHAVLSASDVVLPANGPTPIPR